MDSEAVMLLFGGWQGISLGEYWQHQLLAIGSDNDNVLFAWPRVVLLHAKGEVNELVEGLPLIAQEF
jgi:hypothetical protein